MRGVMTSKATSVNPEMYLESDIPLVNLIILGPSTVAYHKMIVNGWAIAYRIRWAKLNNKMRFAMRARISEATFKPRSLIEKHSVQ